MVCDEKMIDRAQGCLFGQVAGDSLGGLVEFMGEGEIARQFPQGVHELQDGGSWGLIAGQPTDDSEMALALARTICKEGKYDREAVRAAYVVWRDSGPFDIGCATSSGLAGYPDPESQSNGSLMRVSPIGVWGAGQPDDVVAEAARADASIIHPNPVPQAVNVLFALAVAHAIRGESAEAIYSFLLKRAEAADIPESVRATLRRAQTERPAFWPQAGWVLIAFQNAFWQMLHAPSVEAALVETVSLRGDSDTNAAICGALLGALHGAQAIPLRWREAILNCRPDDQSRSQFPRPEIYWPCDIDRLAVRLLSPDHPHEKT